MAEFINRDDSLNQGREKLNKSIQDAEDAKNTAHDADQKADEALSNSESTQEQLDQVVIEGDSSVEAAQARIDAKGNSHETLKQRLDNDYNQTHQKIDINHDEVTSQLAQKANQDDLDNLKADVENMTEISAFNEPFPWYFAHRGAKNLYQEHTMLAYESCLARGNRFLELDVRQLSDGSLIVMHDSTMDRTTDGNWTVSTLTTGYVKSRKVNDKVNEPYNGFGYAPQPIPFLSDVLSRFGRKANYIIESKDRKSATKILEMVQEMKLSNFVMIQSFDLDDLLSVANQGVRLMYLSNSITDSVINQLEENNIKYVGCYKESSDDYIEKLVNSGLKTFVYTVSNRYEKDKFLNLGVHGMFTDDPFYLSDQFQSSSDKYREKVFMDGMIASYGSYRGNFNTESLTPYTWGFTETSQVSDGRDFVLQGWIGELPDEFTIELDFNFEDVQSAGWGSIAFCTPIDYFDDNKTDKSSGYHLLITHGGNTTLYKATNGSATEIERAQGEIINEPITKRIKIAVNSSEIRVSNLTDNLDYTVAETDYRGGFIHFGRRNAQVTFSNVDITR